ncbi:MAG: DUF2505 domain-containing protein [Acidimicrobiales bacterium]
MADVKGSHTYAADVDAVVAMLGDRDATIAKYEGMGHREVQIERLDASDDAITIVSSRVVDADIPGFAKKVLKPTNTMHQTDEWRRKADGTWDGTFDVDVKGAPVHISGTMRLVPGDGDTTHDVTIKVDVKVPLVGGKIADWAAKNDVKTTLDAEFAAGDTYLAARSG